MQRFLYIYRIVYTKKSIVNVNFLLTKIINRTYCKTNGDVIKYRGLRFLRRTICI